MDRFDSVAALRPTRKRPAPQPLRANSENGERLAQLVGGTVERNRYGKYLLVRRWFAQPEPREATPDALKLLLPPQHQRREKATGSSLSPMELADAARWLFLDTET